MKIQVLTLLAILGMAYTDRPLPDINMDLTWTNIQDPTNATNGFFRFMTQAPITYDPNNNATTYSFTPSTGWNLLQHGVKLNGSTDWGVVCDKSTNCNIPDISDLDDVYFLAGSAWYKVAQADTQFSLDGNPPKGSVKASLSVMPNKSMNSRLGNAGIWGLGPVSPLWSYLFNEYDFPKDKEIGFTYWLNTSNANDFIDLYEPDKVNVWNGSQVRVSSNVSSLFEVHQDNFQWFTANQKDQYWGIEGVTVKLSNNKSYTWHTGKACISADADEYFISTKFGDLNTAIMQSICNADQCDGASSLLDAADLEISFTTVSGETKKLVIPATQLAYVDKYDNVQTSIGDMSAYSGWTCADDAEFGFGRMFMYYNQVVMNLNYQQSGSVRKIGVNNYLERPSLAHVMKLHALVWVGLFTVFFFFACMVFLRSKGSISDGVHDEGLGDGYTGTLPAENAQSENEAAKL
jgi:hypothetical protein